MSESGITQRPYEQAPLMGNRRALDEFTRRRSFRVSTAGCHLYRPYASVNSEGTGTEDPCWRSYRDSVPALRIGGGSARQGVGCPLTPDTGAYKRPGLH